MIENQRQIIGRRKAIQNSNARLARGFTLIELLVVLGIIGLLAAAMLNIFGASRRQARDDRRVADLRQAEQALQLFKLKCGFYPGFYNSSSEECLGGLDDSNRSANNPSDWNDLANKLKAAQIGIESIANDPVPSKSYKYRVQLGNQGAIPPTPRGQCYVIWAELETKHRFLDDPKEIDDLTSVSGLYPDTPLNCEDSGLNGFNLCIGNIECFPGR